MGITTGELRKILNRVLDPLLSQFTNTSGQKINDANALSVRPTDYQDEVRLGRREGVSGWNKFAYAILTAAAGEQVVWANTVAFVPMLTADTFTINYDQAQDGSSANGAKQLTFFYLDANGNQAIGLHTLGNTGTDVTSFTGLGINRIAVSSSGSGQRNLGEITIDGTSSGNQQAIVPALGSVTQQTIFHVGLTQKAIRRMIWVNIGKTGGGSPTTLIKAYVFNRGTQTYYEVFRSIVDVSTEQTINLNDPIGFLLNPGDIMFFTADTDVNGTTIEVRFSLNLYNNT